MKVFCILALFVAVAATQGPSHPPHQTWVPGGSESTWVSGGSEPTEVSGGSDPTWVSGGSEPTWVSGGSDPTWVSGGSEPTWVSGGSEPTWVSGGSEPTWVSGGSDPTWLSGGSEPTWVSGGSDPTWVSGGSEPTWVSGGSDPTWVSGGSDPTWVSGGSDPTWVSGGSEPTWVSGGSDPTWVSGGSDPTWVSGGSDPTWVSGGSDPTWVSGGSESTSIPKVSHPTGEDFRPKRAPGRNSFKARKPGRRPCVKCEIPGDVTIVTFEGSPFINATGEYFLIQPGKLSSGERTCGNVSITAENQASIKIGTMTVRDKGRQGRNCGPRRPFKNCKTPGTVINTTYTSIPATNLSGVYILIQRESPRCEKKCVKLDFTDTNQVSIEKAL